MIRVVKIGGRAQGDARLGPALASAVREAGGSTASLCVVHGGGDEVSAMQRRLKEGYLKMIPISEHNIVRLSAPSGPRGEDAVQPVANKRAGR